VTQETDKPDSSGNAAGPNGSNGPESDDGEDVQQQAQLDEEQERDPVEEAKAEVSRIRDQLLRTAADYDNFRKRSRREISDAERRAREDLLRDLLPVFDNLERASKHAETASDVKSLSDGIAMVMRQFLDTLGKLGIERIETAGQSFDPSMHEAIQHMETAEAPPGRVIAEVQSGYRLGDRLLRPAMVVVAKAPSS
jgi:molecular chaperone GrpE